MSILESEKGLIDIQESVPKHSYVKIMRVLGSLDELLDNVKETVSVIDYVNSKGIELANGRFVSYEPNIRDYLNQLSVPVMVPVDMLMAMLDDVHNEGKEQMKQEVVAKLGIMTNGI